MLKKCILHALAICALLVTSCEKENNAELSANSVSDCPDDPATISAARFGDFTPSPVVDNPATYKGLYIDGTADIIGNTAKENSLITYAVNKGVNSFAFYGLRSVINDAADYPKIASFLRRCSQNGITNFIYVIVYYPGSNNGSDTTYIRKYNSSRSLSSERIDGVNLEWEFWNGATTWSTYLTTLKSYYNWTKKVSPNLSNEAYIGWFNNPSNIPQTMANELVKYCDRILVHDYRTQPDVGYMLSRLTHLGQAANNQGKLKKIIVLFSAESSFMGPYYASNSFNTAYQSLLTQYCNTGYSGQSGLRIYGWQIYNYSYARQYRP